MNFCNYLIKHFFTIFFCLFILSQYTDCTHNCSFYENYLHDLYRLLNVLISCQIFPVYAQVPSQLYLDVFGCFVAELSSERQIITEYVWKSVIKLWFLTARKSLQPFPRIFKYLIVAYQHTRVKKIKNKLKCVKDKRRLLAYDCVCTCVCIIFNWYKKSWCYLLTHPFV